ncbi:Uncharacterized protein GBIM_02249 [Gryllus bimaculatus]|nr:Uncharacterized protein GBIM_02249 [Gryllus bimaculatus]
MGAKASTASGGGTSPRARTFSTSSSSDVVAGGTGFSLLRAIPGAVSSDRQRARSLSSVPDSHSSHEAIGIPNSNVGAYDISESPETDSSSPEDHVLDSPLAANISLGRVYTAHSLPSHIWSLNVRGSLAGMRNASAAAAAPAPAANAALSPRRRCHLH